jgi:16S rRNA (cytosine1402-N4)-methyltransferase
MNNQHISVLKDEAIELLAIQPEGIYVDATLGAGGHASSILTRLSTGHLYAFDQDEVARSIARQRLAEVGTQFTIIPENFTHMAHALSGFGVQAVDGILFDIGVSSMQLDEEERGFSYRFDAPLDMRMNRAQELNAHDVVNTYTQAELTRIFYRYGEEKFAPSIARKIVQVRTIKPIETTFELIDVIRSAMPMKKQREKHPAKKVFQAIRIEVNDEINVFTAALEQAIALLRRNGRLVVITFHSLEDRICKQVFNNYGKKIGPQNELEKLVMEEVQRPIKILTKKPIVASAAELAYNPRAKSAKMRVIEKIV